MLKKITQILLAIVLISIADFILSFSINFLFKKNVYLNESFIVYIKHSWFTIGLISTLAVGVTAFVYLFFYYAFANTKYFTLYEKRGGVFVFLIIAFFFMGSLIFAFATSLFGIVNLIRLCISAWLITFIISKIIEKKPSEIDIET